MADMYEVESFYKGRPVGRTIAPVTREALISEYIRCEDCAEGGTCDPYGIYDECIEDAVLNTLDLMGVSGHFTDRSDWSCNIKVVRQ